MLEGIQYAIGVAIIELTTIVVGGLASLMSWSMVIDERRGSPTYKRPMALIMLTVAVCIDLIAWCPVFLADYMHLDGRYPVFISAGLVAGAFILVLITLGLGIRERNGARPAVVGAGVIIILASVGALVVMFS